MGLWVEPFASCSTSLCVGHTYSTGRPGVFILEDCEMYDFVFSLFISICHLLKTFCAMENTKASKDFRAVDTIEQNWGQKRFLWKFFTTVSSGIVKLIETGGFGSFKNNIDVGIVDSQTRNELEALTPDWLWTPSGGLSLEASPRCLEDQVIYFLGWEGRYFLRNAPAPAQGGSFIWRKVSMWKYRSKTVWNIIPLMFPFIENFPFWALAKVLFL